MSSRCRPSRGPSTELLKELVHLRLDAVRTAAAIGCKWTADAFDSRSLLAFRRGSPSETEIASALTEFGPPTFARWNHKCATSSGWRDRPTVFEKGLHPITPISSRSTDEPTATAEPVEMGEARTRVDSGGRLRQRIPLRNPADSMPAWSRSRRSCDLCRQLQQDALPGTASWVSHRTARSSSPSRRGASALQTSTRLCSIRPSSPTSSWKATSRAISAACGPRTANVWRHWLRLPIRYAGAHFDCAESKQVCMSWLTWMELTLRECRGRRRSAELRRRPFQHISRDRCGASTVSFSDLRGSAICIAQGDAAAGSRD